MISHTISLTEKSYPIYITSSYSELGKCLKTAQTGEKAVIITDSNVSRYQLKECAASLEDDGFKIEEYVIKAGEGSKNLDTIKDIYRFLVSVKAERNSVIIALGGGVVGDIAGFAAATFLRGINLVQVPTSLLAQADSSIGGKVGVDFEGIKNVIGSFYQPRLVYINVNSLRTLPIRELKSGFAEVLKHGIIADAEFFDYIVSNIQRIMDFDERVLQYVLKVNCSIKGRIVEQDERESGLRAILNFGHTIGHAIESVSGFALLHGECVSIGMAGAFRIARHLGMVDEKLQSKVEETLIKIGLPVNTAQIDKEKVYRQMFYDKKVKRSKLTFILPRRIGEVVQRAIDNETLIKGVLDEIIN